MVICVQSTLLIKTHIAFCFCFCSFFFVLCATNDVHAKPLPSPSYRKPWVSHAKLTCKHNNHMQNLISIVKKKSIKAPLMNALRFGHRIFFSSCFTIKKSMTCVEHTRSMFDLKFGTLFSLAESRLYKNYKWNAHSVQTCLKAN